MNKITVRIDGMACGMCEAHVNDAVRSAFHVKKVRSRYRTGVTEIVSEELPDPEKLREVIEKTGYRVTAITVDRSE